MFKGTVDFAAQIKGNGLTFPRLDFDPNEPGVIKVEIEGPTGGEIRGTVHLDPVATRDEGRALARKVISAALDRIAYFHGNSIENARCTGDAFSPLNPQPGMHTHAVGVELFISGTATSTVGLNAANLKAELERDSPPGEHNFGLFRSARLSMSPVEEFMHLYNILLMLHDDKQANVDAYIKAEEPDVPLTQHPDRKEGVMETVYTRLRNEFAHKREGSNLNITKAEMADRLGNLAGLTRQAIKLNA